jgi:hypothetical protein
MDGELFLQPEVIDEAILVFPTVGNTTSWALTRSELERLKLRFPTIDVLAECRKLLAWVEADKSRRKTARGMMSFLTTNLARATDRQKTAPTGPIDPKRAPKFAVEQPKIEVPEAINRIKTALLRAASKKSSHPAAEILQKAAQKLDSPPNLPPADLQEWLFKLEDAMYRKVFEILTDEEKKSMVEYVQEKFVHTEVKSHEQLPWPLKKELIRDALGIPVFYLLWR